MDKKISKASCEFFFSGENITRIKFSLLVDVDIVIIFWFHTVKKLNKICYEKNSMFTLLKLSVSHNQANL